MMPTEVPVKKSIDYVLDRIAQRPAALAALRRGVGRPLEESPDSWPYVMDVVGDDRRREEAAHVTLSLFALHQQSQKSGSISQTGWGLGKACGRLKFVRGSGGASEEGVERRFKAAMAADTPETLAVHLRGLVTILRGEGVPLDYAQLYWDLCRWQRPEERAKVCLKWGREYFKTVQSENDKETTS